MRIKIFIIVVVVIYSNVFSQVNTLTLKDLCEKSDNIVYCKVKNIKSYWNEEKNRIYTDIDVEVITDYMKKLYYLDIIKLTYYGGRIDGITTAVDGDPYFIKGKECIVFLKKSKNSNLFRKNYYVLGDCNGKFDVFTVIGFDKMIKRHQIEEYLMSAPNESFIPITNEKSINFDSFQMLINYYLNLK